LKVRRRHVLGLGIGKQSPKTITASRRVASGGRFAGKRILSPKPVKLMSSSQLSRALLTGRFGIGYGFNVPCCLICQKPVCPTARGRFSWMVPPELGSELI
jgi:hypothetical protein